ncbi:MAG: hypothetical protein ACI8RD_014220 [Bacillariaceae sp.]|jgi:hypothetical protein
MRVTLLVFEMDGEALDASTHSKRRRSAVIGILYDSAN